MSTARRSSPKERLSWTLDRGGRGARSRGRKDCKPVPRRPRGLPMSRARRDVPQGVLDLVVERQAAREARDFARADALRDQVRAAGWLLRDTREGPELAAAPPWEPVDPAAIRPRWDEPDQHAVSVIAHVTGWPEDVARALHALATHCAPRAAPRAVPLDYEVLLLDDGADAATGQALEDLAEEDPAGRVRVLHLESPEHAS